MKPFQICKTLSGILLAVVLVEAIPSAIAHGERAQEPYLRTRTVHWYDVQWSTDKIGVNEQITLTGKFRLFGDWPDAVEPPDMVFLGATTDGPSMVRIESYLNGIPARQSFRDLEIGRDYEYRMVLAGRLPGRFHIHPNISVKGSGGLLGPGKWVEITGDHADFKLSHTAISGEQIDNIEYYGVQHASTWHAIWIVLAAAWLLWWVRRPILLPRYMLTKMGDKEELLTTSMDLRVGIFLLVLIFSLIIGGYLWAEYKWPRTIPLQSGSMYTEPLPTERNPLQVKFRSARYDVPGRAMEMTVQVTNDGARAVRLGEFSSANLRFVNMASAVAKSGVDLNYPRELVPEVGLEISDDQPIAPGETKTVHLRAADVAWELERLTSFLTDVDSKVGALLFFYDGEGKRYINEIGGPILPKFTDL